MLRMGPDQVVLQKRQGLQEHKHLIRDQQPWSEDRQVYERDQVDNTKELRGEETFFATLLFLPLLTCQVTGWCPVESNSSLPSDTIAVLEDTKHFQLEIRNHVQFSNFLLDWGIRRVFSVKEAVEEAIKNFSKCKRCKTYAYRVSDLLELDGNWGQKRDLQTSAKPAVKKATKPPSRIFKSLKIQKRAKPTSKPVKQKDTSSQLTYHDIAMKVNLITLISTSQS